MYSLYLFKEHFEAQIDELLGTPSTGRNLQNNNFLHKIKHEKIFWERWTKSKGEVLNKVYQN